MHTKQYSCVSELLVYDDYLQLVYSLHRTQVSCSINKHLKMLSQFTLNSKTMTYCNLYPCHAFFILSYYKQPIATLFLNVSNLLISHFPGWSKKLIMNREDATAKRTIDSLHLAKHVIQYMLCISILFCFFTNPSKFSVKVATPNSIQQRITHLSQ